MALSPIDPLQIERPRRFGRAGKRGSMADALDTLANARRIYVSGGSAAPIALDQALAAERHRWSDLELVCDRLVEPLAVFEHPGEPFGLISLQPSPAVDAMRSGSALVSDPVAFSRFGDRMAPDGPWPIDAAIVHVSPPGPEGRFSLGVSVATPLSAIAAAPLVIAQVNPQMPYSFGAGELARDEIDILVDVDHPLIVTKRQPPDAIARTIGALVASTVTDGATLQLGVGALADAVMQALVDHKRLAVHSGMISDGVIELHASGAVTGTTHPSFPGRIVAGLVGGTRAAFDFIDRNPEVVMVPTSISHGHDLLASLENFTAINSAVEVALDGSANGEVIGSRVISGPGGAPDYARAATAAANGRYVVALPATASKGRVSRIVSALGPDIPATVEGRYVSTVVTEYGIASIAGLNGTERADALSAIAAPDLRNAI